MDLQTLIEKREFIKDFIDEHNRCCNYFNEEIIVSDDRIENIIQKLENEKVKK